MPVDVGVGYLLVSVEIGEEFGDICEFDHGEQLSLLVLLVLLVDFVEHSFDLGDVGEAGLVFVFGFEFLQHQLLDVLGFIVY